MQCRRVSLGQTIKTRGPIRCSRASMAATAQAAQTTVSPTTTRCRLLLRSAFTNGLQFQANYVWSHMLTSIDSSGWGSTSGNDYYQDPYNVAANYGASNFDIRNSFKTAVIYDLPFGKGRQFLNNNWLADETIGGWQVSPTVIWSSGVPYSMITSSNNSFDLKGNGQQYPNQLGNPNPSHRSLQQWFNPAAFAQPAAGTYGNTRRNNLVWAELSTRKCCRRQDLPYSVGKHRAGNSRFCE